MKNVKIILINILIVLVVLTSITVHIKAQNKSSIQTSIHNYVNTTVGMEKIIASYMANEQQLVNSWANSLNSYVRPIESTVNFLRAAIGDLNSSAHIILEDDYSVGFSTHAHSADSNDFSCSYEKTANLHEYESSPDKVLDKLKTNENLIKMTTAYTNPVTGNKVVAFGQKVNVIYQGKVVNAFLLYVLPVDFLMEKWVFATDYNNVDIALIENKGNYITKPKSMKNSNFYEFIYSYNKIPQETIRDTIFSHHSGSFEALDSRGNKNLYAYAVMDETGNHVVVMGMPFTTLGRHSGETVIIVITLVALMFALIVNIIYFNTASRKEHEQIEIIKLQGSQLAQALTEAQNANNAKTTFLNSMSHDIRTPMNAIIGFTSLAISHIEQTSAVRDYLNKIMTSSEHLLSLINDVLDMSRIESGKVQIDLKEEFFPDVMKDLKNILQPEIKAKKLNFYIDMVDVVHENIICDKLRLNQILINLSSNAIKFTESGGTVGIKVLEKKSAIPAEARFEFHVIDTGIGMSEEFINHIFEPFTREENNTVRRIQGTGLGMAITKNIIELMNGQISVISEQGKGSEFIVDLAFRTGESENKIEVIKKLENYRTLIVDARVDTCLNHSKMLKNLGLRTEWTTSGKEAEFRAKIAEDEKDPFKVFVIDCFKEDLSAFEIVQKIKSTNQNENPIIIITADDVSEIEEQVKDAGVTAICNKPLFMSEFYEVLEGTEIPKESQKKSEIVSEKYKGKRVLLVDDVELNQEIAIEILHEAGIQVEVCGNGQEAVDMLSKSKPGYFDLVLMDIMMPVLDGHEATKKIRKLENLELANIPIIAMTANAFDEDRKAAIESGMNDYLAKPFQIEKLYELMKIYL